MQRRSDPIPYFRRARELLGRANTAQLLELDAVGIKQPELSGAPDSQPVLRQDSAQTVLALPGNSRRLPSLRPDPRRSPSRAPTAARFT